MWDKSNTYTLSTKGTDNHVGPCGMKLLERWSCTVYAIRPSRIAQYSWLPIHARCNTLNLCRFTFECARQWRRSPWPAVLTAQRTLARQSGRKHSPLYLKYGGDAEPLRPSTSVVRRRPLVHFCNYQLQKWDVKKTYNRHHSIIIAKAHLHISEGSSTKGRNTGEYHMMSVIITRA